MEDEKWSFKIGDSVQLSESFMQEVLETTGDSSHEGLKEYSKQKKIQAIYRNKDNLAREVLVFSSEKKTAIRENQFRLATEKEIKEFLTEKAIDFL